VVKNLPGIILGKGNQFPPGKKKLGFWEVTQVFPVKGAFIAPLPFPILVPQGARRCHAGFYKKSLLKRGTPWGIFLSKG